MCVLDKDIIRNYLEIRIESYSTKFHIYSEFVDKLNEIISLGGRTKYACPGKSVKSRSA